MLNVREHLSWRFGHVWRSRFLNLASVTFGILFSYASIIFGEFYFGESKEPCETRVIKFSRKLSILQYSVLYLHIKHSDCSVIQGRWVKLTDKKPRAASKMQLKYYIYIYICIPNIQFLSNKKLLHCTKILQRLHCTNRSIIENRKCNKRTLKPLKN